ncbi:MAG: TetR family transcriptional regulator [Acidimicrobiales bacterium]|nr:TetR family transcriptional regulator [Acidimicrobiales bacterium]
MTPSRPKSNRPFASSRAAVEKVALELFAERGFDDTPVEEIAAAAGISRRTFFRYFPTKADVLFGEFDVLMDGLDAWFDEAPDDQPMFAVIAEATMRFNRIHTDGLVAHRERMKLILQTPALRANGVLRQEEWVGVIARYAARRLGVAEGSLEAQLAAQLSIGAANAAYDQWLRGEERDLAELVDRSFAMIETLSRTAPAEPRSGKRRSASAS